MTVRVPLMRPSLGVEELNRIHDVVASGWLVNGPEAEGFEQALSARLDGARVVTVSSGSAALHLAIIALARGGATEVVLPAFTFPSVANMVEVCGLRSVFVDISLDDFGPDPEALTAALGDDTAAVVWVYQFGNAPRSARAIEAARARGIPVIEDAACSLGVDLEGRPTGTITEAGCLSFHPRKVITTGEGGALITHDPALADRFLALRNHGQDPHAQGFERFTMAGFNYRIGEMNAAMGRAQLVKLDYFLEKRRRLGARYAELLAGVDGVTVPAAYREGRSNFQTLAVLLHEGIDREATRAALAGHGIETHLGGYSIPHQPYYVERYGPPGDRFPNAARAFHSTLALPLFPEMRDEDVRLVVARLQEVIG
jgi:perosamine synthetase